MQGIFRIARQMALVALMLRALMPSGWMPDANGGLMICSATVATTLGVIHHDGAPEKQDSRQQECPFAAASQLAAAPDAPQIALPAVHAFAAQTDRAYAATVAARFTPQSPRAPPLNA